VLKKYVGLPAVNIIDVFCWFWGIWS